MVMPPISAASYRAAARASALAAPVLEAKGFFDFASQARVRALRYEKLATFAQEWDGTPSIASSTPTRAQQDEFARRIKLMEGKRNAGKLPSP